MSSGFYKISSEILKFNPYNDKDVEYIKFNAYLSRKENLQRMSNELSKGLFKMSYTTVISDTGLSRGKIQKFIKWFEDNGIIQCISKSIKKGECSIYAYNPVYLNEKTDTDFDTDSDTDFSSNFNTSSSASNTDSNTNSNTSKKEYIKKNNKKDKEKISFDEIIKTYTENNSLVEAINNFIDMRNKIKKPLTINALNLLIKKLDRLGSNDLEKIEILENSIMNCWQGIFELNNKKEPIAVGSNENKNIKVNPSICNNRRKYTQACDIG